MEKARLMTVRKIGGSLSVTIPSDIAQAMDVQRGDQLYATMPNSLGFVFWKVSGNTDEPWKKSKHSA